MNEVLKHRDPWSKTYKELFKIASRGAMNASSHYNEMLRMRLLSKQITGIGTQLTLGLEDEGGFERIAEDSNGDKQTITGIGVINIVSRGGSSRERAYTLTLDGKVWLPKDPYVLAEDGKTPGSVGDFLEEQQQQDLLSEIEGYKTLPA